MRARVFDMCEINTCVVETRQSPHRACRKSYLGAVLTGSTN